MVTDGSRHTAVALDCFVSSLLAPHHLITTVTSSRFHFSTFCGMYCVLEALSIAYLDFSPFFACHFTSAMGATLSRLGYTPLQQPCQKSHDCISHRLHQGWGPTLILGNEDAASPSIISLYTRLTALEKDLQISQEGNTNKEAIIQYLLNLSKGSLSTLDTETEKLKEQNSNLKKKIARMNEDSKRLKDKLRTALDIIFASSMQSVTAVGSQSVSSSCSNRCKSPSSEILIDLLGSCEGDASAVLSEEDTTLLNNDIHDDTLDVEGIKTEITPGQSLHESQNSLDSEFQDLPYIVHFADGDEEDKPKEGVEFITKVPILI